MTTIVLFCVVLLPSLILSVIVSPTEDHGQPLEYDRPFASHEEVKTYSYGTPAPPLVPLTRVIEITRNNHFAVPVIRHVGIPVPQPYAVEVPHPVPVAVPQPYAVNVPVPHPVAVPIYRTRTVTVEKAVPYEVEKRVPYPVDRPYPVHYETQVPVEVPKPYPVAVPVVKSVLYYKKESSSSS